MVKATQWIWVKIWQRNFEGVKYLIIKLLFEYICKRVGSLRETIPVEDISGKF